MTVSLLLPAVMKITGSYDDWRYPMVWQTLYFSVAVWISLAMVAYPFRLRRTGRASDATTTALPEAPS